jgi:hypothetical protein
MRFSPLVIYVGILRKLNRELIRVLAHPSAELVVRNKGVI